MELKEIARQLQGKAANAALRMPISWINLLAGPPQIERYDIVASITG